MGELPIGELVNSSAEAKRLRDSEFLAPLREPAFAEIINSRPGVDAIRQSDFAKHFCNKEVMHLTQADRSRFEYMFSWDIINQILSQNLLDEKRLRITRDGLDVPSAFFRDATSERHPVNWAKVRDLLKQNASVVMNRAHDLSPAVRRLACQMEIALRHKVYVNGYMTFGSGGAFAMHYDPHDVLVLQIYGTKHWFVYEDPEPSPTYREKKKSTKPAPREVAFETVLQAGDALFVPRGHYHRAAVTDTDSVHLTFGIHTARVMDFVDWVKDDLLTDEAFRKDIVTLEGNDAVDAQDRAIKERLCEIINGTSIWDYLEGREKLKAVSQVRLGPKAEIHENSLLSPLLRYADAYRRSTAKNGKQPSPEIEKILAFMLENPVSTAGEIRRGIENVLDQDALNSTLAELVNDCWIEIIR